MQLARRQALWANRIVANARAGEIHEALRLLKELRSRLETEG